MTIVATIALVFGLFSLTFMLNLPFGYLRRKTRRLSFLWFVCIHAPIPIVALGRIASQIDYRYIPLFLLAAIMGQVWGGRLEF